MPGVLPILFFLVPLLVLVGIVAVIVASARHGVPEADQGIGTVRRIFVYVLSLAGLATSGIGMVLLVRFLLDSVFGRAALAVEQSTLALGIALTVVGTPVWLGSSCTIFLLMAMARIMNPDSANSSATIRYCLIASFLLPASTSVSA